jgi:hypothetical protein
MAFEVVGKVEVLWVGVPFESDAEHLRALSLVPVSSAKEACERRHAWAITPKANLETNDVAMLRGVEDDQDLYTLLFPIDSGQEVEEVAIEFRVFLQDPSRVDDTFSRRLAPHLPV